MEKYKDLNEKLQMLYDLTMEVNVLIPPEEKCPYNWQEFFEECANLRNAFFDIGTEDGIVPEFSEVEYVSVEIVMICKVDESEIETIFDNFLMEWIEENDDLYEKGNYEVVGGGFIKFTWTGSVQSEDADSLICLTHHAEGIYEGTSAEHVHVEVRIGETWYGKAN